jgi:tRNA(Ile)-lysidine synthase
MLEDKVEAFLKRHSISMVEKTVIVGVSGGPDSLALLHFLWKRQKLWQMRLIALHVDHMFRGEQSYLEAMFVKEFCMKFNIAFEWTQLNVTEYMEMHGLSAQVAARECRFHFFKEMMQKYNASYLILGHHGDDQIETILMRMTRGSSGKARAGIAIRRPFHSGEILRPFLTVNKEEIERYCEVHHLEPRRDPSNEKPTYSRNRFRLEVLPFLKKENPAVHEHFQRMSEELYQDEAFLEELTAEEMNKVMKSKNAGEVTLQIDKFFAMPLPLQRRGIQLILNYLYHARPASLSALHIEHVFSLLKSPHPNGRLEFPGGLHIIRSYQICEFLFSIKEEPPYRFELYGPGSIQLPDGQTITLEYTKERTIDHGNDVCILNPSDIHFPIIVRTRKDGDRIQPKGMSGTKKIKDIFIDLKIPQTKRNSWPVVMDGTGRILWLPGLKVSSDEARHEAMDVYLLLKYNKH